jgi:hypothetical protein
MTPSSVASFSFFCLLVLLLPPQHGASSSHASYKLGSRQFFFKTPGNSQQASTVPPPTNCSSMANGRAYIFNNMIKYRICYCAQGFIFFTNKTYSVAMKFTSYIIYNINRNDVPLLSQKEWNYGLRAR